MSEQWFYIQQWARRRWSYVGTEISFSDAHELFKALTNTFSEGYCKPLALVQHPEDKSIGKVIMSKEDQNGWEIIMCNGLYSNGGKDEPLLVRKVSNG